MPLTLEHTSDVHSVAFSSNGEHVVSGSSDKTIKVWNVATGRLEQTLNGHTNWVLSVAFNNDGTKVVSGSSDNTIKVWNVATGETEQTLNGHNATVYSVAFNDDGTKVVSGSLDRTIKVWDVATGEMEQTFNGYNRAVYSVAFSPNGEHIVSGSCCVKVWNVATGRLERTFIGHNAQVNSVAFSPDGKHIASASNDETIKVWDTLSIFFPFMKDYEEYKEYIRILERGDDKVIVEVLVDNYPLILYVTVYKGQYEVERGGFRPGENLSLESMIKDPEKYDKVKKKGYTSIGEMIESLYDKDMLDSNVDSNVDSTVTMGKRKRKRKLHSSFKLKL